MKAENILVVMAFTIFYLLSFIKDMSCDAFIRRGA